MAKHHDSQSGVPQEPSRTGPSMAGLGEKKIRHTHSTKPVEPEPDADDGALPDEAVDQRRKLHKNEPPKT